ncbi:hypothetical protein PhCBS80983_g01820 [Powellomyces hirtus]|uniref:Uncharacterized protein n=1 Tax=Powellomyces hirtus TaxID=109895 RepID=A0A507E8I4_9FUNG|nr:hypothetical protein PhCBS80983_g01820 [Powellomyces hirtus]
MLELLVVGAGPHSLALMSALFETRPDKYTEHPDNALLFFRAAAPTTPANGTILTAPVLARSDHLNWRPRKAENKMVANALALADDRHPGARLKPDAEAGHTCKIRSRSKKHVCRQNPVVAPIPLDIAESIRVLDRLPQLEEGGKDSTMLGGWMPLWRRQMQFLRVPHLRSPVNHHPDPVDPSMLWQYAMRSHRTSDTDLVPLRLPRTGCYNGPFLLPSTDLFFDFCGRVIVNGFALQDLVHQGNVAKIRPVPHCDCPENAASLDVDKMSSRKCDHFEVVLHDGQVLEARNVVVATGSAGAAHKIPQWANDLTAKDGDRPPHAIVHVFDLALNPGHYLPPCCGNGCSDDLKGMRIVIIGGGITSIHLSRVALDMGCRDINLLVRSPIRVQPFDVSAEWLGPHRSPRIAAFWSDASPAGRAERLRNARFPEKAEQEQGGSGATVTEEALALVTDGLADGRMRIVQPASVLCARWNIISDQNAGKRKPDSQSTEQKQWALDLEDGASMHCDIIWLATGTAPNASTDPILEDVFKQHPVDLVNGLPQLRPDLSWSRACPGLFVTGPLAALEVGPGAPNLAGARLAAARIAPALRDRFRVSVRL